MSVRKPTPRSPRAVHFGSNQSGRRQRVRHSLAGLPIPPVAGPWAWFRADYLLGLSGLPADSSSVTQWQDISGNGRHATTGTAPTFKTNIQNGLPVVRFSAASTQHLVTGQALVQPITVLAAVAFNDTAGGKAIVYSSLGVNALLYGGSAEAITLYAGANINEDVLVGWNVVNGVFNGASSAVYDGHDGAAATGNAGANALSNVNIGGDTAGGFAMDGDIGEIIIYSSALSLADINTVGTAMGARWGITWDNRVS